MLAFSHIASSVPNTQGRAMLSSATTAQRLAENRIESPDGYLILLVSPFCSPLRLRRGPEARGLTERPPPTGQPNALFTWPSRSG